MSNPHELFSDEVFLNKIHNFVRNEPADAVVCPSIRIYRPSAIPPLPEITSTISPGFVKFEFDFGEEMLAAETAASTVARDSVFTVSRMCTRRLVHDVSFKCLRLTNASLDYVCAEPSDMSKITPDFCDVDGNSLVVFEYATRTSNNRDDPPDYAAWQKKEKYLPALRKRLGKFQVGLFVFAVSSSELATNCPFMNQLQVDNIVYMNRLANAMYDHLKYKYPNDNLVDDDLATVMHEWSDNFSDAPFKPLGQKVMTKDFFYFCEDWINNKLAHNQELIDYNIKWCQQKAMQELQEEPALKHPKDSINQNLKRFENYVKEFYDVPYDHTIHKTHQKALFLVPFVLMEPLYEKEKIGKLYNSISEFGSSIDFIGPPIDDANFRVWSDAIAKYNAGQVTRSHHEQSEEDKFIDPHYSSSELNVLQGELKELRSSYHRVKIDINQEDWVSLAVHGVKGKKYRNEQEVKDHVDITRKLFHPSTNVDDIHEFICTAGPYLTTQMRQTAERTDINLLIHKAYTLHEQAGSNIENFQSKIMLNMRSYMKTRLAIYARWLNDIYYEIAVSRRSHTKENNFIFKRLRYYNTWLLLYCTDSTKHTFYSIGWFKKDMLNALDEVPWQSTVFRNVRTNGTFCYTPFFSVNDPKLVNGCRFEALSMIYFTVFHEIQQSHLSVRHEPLTGTMARSLVLCLSLALHNKQGPADAALISRYMMLNGFVSWPKSPNPGPLISKLQASTRSRLEVYINNRLITASRCIVTNPFLVDDTGTWRNIINWIDCEIITPGHLINSFYYCYAIGKVKTVEVNSLHKIVEAVVATENLLPNDVEGLGPGDKPAGEIGTHEFSLCLLTEAIRRQRAKLTKLYGSRYQDCLTQKLLENFSQASVDDLATLKASSKFNKEWIDLQRKDIYHREKVAVEMIRITREARTDRYFSVLRKCYDTVMNQDALYVDIFPKDQVAGVREIYVLTAEERMLQNFIEHFAKILCFTSESEMITHPNKKHQVIHDHITAINSLTNKVTHGTSSDMTKWNHYHYISKFYMLLAPFVRPEIRPVIFSFMSLWEYKKVMIPQRLTQALMKETDLKTLNQTIQDYHAAIKYNKSSRCFRGGENCATISHGFMQGIYQMTSSYFHVTFMDYYKLLMQSEFKKLKSKGSIRECSNLYMTTLLSSDDASLYLTITYGDEKELVVSSTVAAYFTNIRKYLALLFGMKDSVKTVDHTMDFIEFNSQYTLSMSTYEPLLRQIHAIANITDAEGILGRQEEAYGLLEGMPQYGCSLFAVNFLQIAQCINQYRLLGSSVNPYWDKFVELMHKTPDPSLGFILLDDPRAPGLFGFNYNLWIASYDKVLQSKLAYALYYSEIGEFKKKIAAGLTKHGMIMGVTAIIFGDLRKAREKFISTGLPEDWRTKYENHPRWLFNRPRDQEQFETKIAQKFNQPGAIAAFAGGSISALIAVKSSVFALHRLCLRLRKLDVSNDEITSGSTKNSILRELMMYNDGPDENLYWYDERLRHQLSEDERDILFPASTSYKELQGTANLFKNLNNLETMLRRESRKRVRLSVLQSKSNYLPNLGWLLSRRWRLVNVKVSISDEEKTAFDIYKARLPFLRETIQETVEEGPFEDVIDLANFIISHKDLKRDMTLNTGPIESQMGYTELKCILRSHYLPGHNLIPESKLSMVSEELKTITEAAMSSEPRFRYHTRSRDINRHISTLYHEMLAIFSFPLREAYKLILFKRAIIKHPVLEPEIARETTRNNVLCAMQAFWMKDESRFLAAVRTMKHVVIGRWIIKQQQDPVTKRWHGKGKWMGSVDGIYFSVAVDTINTVNVIELVVTAKDEHAIKVLEILPYWCRKNDVDIRARFFEMPASKYSTSTRFAPKGVGWIRWYIIPNYEPSKAGCLVNLFRSGDIHFHLGMTSIKMGSFASEIASYNMRSTDYMPTNSTSNFFMKVINSDTNDVSLNALLHLWVNNNGCTLNMLSKYVRYLKGAKDARGNALSNEATCREIERWAHKLVDSALSKSGVKYTSSRALEAAVASGMATFEGVPDDFEFDTNQVFRSNVDYAARQDEALACISDILVEPTLDIDIDEERNDIEAILNKLRKEEPRVLSITNSHPITDTLLSEHEQVRRHWDDIISNRHWCRSDPAEVEMVKYLAAIDGVNYNNWGTSISKRMPLQNVSKLSHSLPQAMMEIDTDEEIDLAEFDDL